MPEKTMIIDTVANGWTVRPQPWDRSICGSHAEIYVFETLAALQLALPALLEKPKHLRNPLIDAT